MATCSITVNIGPTVSFAVTSSLSTVQVGLPVKITVQALDAGGNKTKYNGTASLWTNSPCPIGDSNNGAWSGTASIPVVGGSGSQYVLLELAGEVNVTAAVGFDDHGRHADTDQRYPGSVQQQHPGRGDPRTDAGGFLH